MIHPVESTLYYMIKVTVKGVEKKNKHFTLVLPTDQVGRGCRVDAYGCLTSRYASFESAQCRNLYVQDAQWGYSRALSQSFLQIKH